MAVRPFYINAHIDGRKTPLAGGTQSKRGTQEITLYQRDQGEITKPFRIVQRSFYQGDKLKLVTEVYYQGECIKTHETDY